MQTLRINNEIKTFHWLIVFLILLIFVLLKLEDLSMPHYWDEAWSYAVAVHKMYDQGPTLLPGIVEVEATRGHPLFYYASASAWMKLFGDNLMSKHSFSLFTSLLLIASIYYITLRMSNIRTAIFSTLLFSSQIIFYVQSSLLLPEVMVSLFSLWTLYAVSVRNYWCLTISLTLLFFTKESGFVMGIVLLLYYAYVFIKSRNKVDKRKLLISLAIPSLLILSFFIYQYSIYGWLFFPEHVGYMNISFRKVVKVILIGSEELFIAQHKYLLIISSLGLIVYYIYRTSKKINISIDKKLMTFWVLSAIFGFLYLIFTSLNFFSQRYLLALLPLSIIAISIFIYIASIQFSNSKIFIIAFLILSVSILDAYLFRPNREINDVSLGMNDALCVQMATTQYLKENADRNAPISWFSHFHKINLVDPSCGFVKVDESFLNVNYEIDNQTEFVGFDNIEFDDRYEFDKSKSQF